MLAKADKFGPEYVGAPTAFGGSMLTENQGSFSAPLAVPLLFQTMMVLWLSMAFPRTPLNPIRKLRKSVCSI